MEDKLLKQKDNRKVVKFVSKWGTIMTIILLFLIFTFGNWDSAQGKSLWLTTDNMITIVRSISITAIIAIGLTFTLAVNGMDLSIGATANFACTFIMTMFIWYDFNMGVSIILTLLVGLTVAAVNSLLIVKFKIPDMVATLAVMFMYQGVALTYSNGGAITERMVRPDGTQAIGLVPKMFRSLGKEPWLIVLLIVVVLFAHFVLNYTKHGRYMYAVGGNEEAARLSGIPVKKYKIIAYYYLHYSQQSAVSV